MDVVVWILQGLVAVAFLIAGAMKLARPRKVLADSGMAWVEDFSDRAVQGIGALEVLGALGLVLPAVTGIAPVLVPIAAAGLVLVMAGAVVTHVRRRETYVPPLVLGLLAATVAVLRFGPYPL